MKAKMKWHKLLSLLLALVMLLSLLPTTALAASPDASNVYVDGDKSFYNPTRLYYKNGDSDGSFTGTSTDFNAAYDPATGTLTLDGYNGKGITVGGVGRTDITVKLVGTNIINDGSLENAVGGDITVTSSDGGTLSITRTLSGGNDAIGIETGLSASYTTGNVTIKGDAKVTINMTHNGTKGYDNAYGIFAKENITISENASVDITCATPNNTTGGGNCNGLYAAKDVTIDTNGTIKIDVTNAGRDKDNGYSYGVYHMRTATLTKVGNMEVQWKKEGNSTRYSGGAFTRGATFSDTDHAINVDETNCYVSYRYGTPRKVTAQNGQLTGPGVKYENGSGYFLAGDKVNITPAMKESWDDQEIPFKEWTSSDVTLDKSATTASNFFTVPGKDVTVTAKHSPFVGAPTFTPTGTTGTQGTLTFKTVVKADDAYEGFRLVKEGNENNESSYISIRSDTTSTSSPYEYSYKASIYALNEGNYYVVAYLNNHYYLGEKVTVNYTVPVTTYTVSFDANGGTGTMADVTGVSGEYTLPENGFTAPTGKYFKGWAFTADGTVISGTTIDVTADTTLYAIWGDITYIDSVNVTVIKPVAGANPQDAVSNTDNVTVTQTDWYHNGTTHLSASDTFVAGETYEVIVLVEIDSDEYVFADLVKVVINGSIIVEEFISDVDVIYFEAYFTATEEPAGYTVSGTATSFNSDTDNVTIQLILKGCSEAAYETIVKGNSATYSIANVLPGTYTMKVMKKNHATREYTVTVGDKNVIQNVDLCMLGDVNGDGEVNSNDYAMLRNYVQCRSTLTEEQKKIADINGDGAVDAFDAIQLDLYINGVVDINGK